MSYPWYRKTISILLILVFSINMLGCSAIFDKTYSLSGQVVNNTGEGIGGVELDFGEKYDAVITDSNGFWEKSGLQDEVIVMPSFNKAVFVPVKKEFSAGEDNVKFVLFNEMEKGMTSPSGMFVAHSELSAGEEIEVTVVVNDETTGKPLEGIEAEINITGESIEIILQDEEGLYYPEVIVIDMNNLEDYPNLEITRGSLFVTLVARLIAKTIVEKIIEHSREAAAIVAVGLDVAGTYLYIKGGIAVATGVGALPGIGAILLSVGMNVTSDLLMMYAVQDGEDKVMASPITIFIFESRDSEQYTELKVPAGSTLEDIDDAVQYVVGDRKYEVLVPEENPAGAYYNRDGSPKIVYIYITDDSSICLDFGTIDWNDGTYTGEMKDCLPHGYGIWTRSDGFKYVGEYIEGMRHGRGTWYDPRSPHPENIRYIGDWKDNQRHGEGTCYYNGGDWYEGEWKNDQRHGFGISYIPTNTPSGTFRKIGEWRDGKEYKVENITGCGTQRWFSGFGY